MTLQPDKLTRSWIYAPRRLLCVVHEQTRGPSNVETSCGTVIGNDIEHAREREYLLVPRDDPGTKGQCLTHRNTLLLAARYSTNSRIANGGVLYVSQTKNGSRDVGCVLHVLTTPTPI